MRINIKECSDPDKKKELEVRLKDYRRSIKTKQHYPSYSYYGICAVGVSTITDVIEVLENAECIICNKELFRIVKGVKIPLINNAKNEIDLDNCFGITPTEKWHEIEKVDKDDYCCELCESEKFKDIKKNKSEMFGNHHGVNKWLPVVITGKVEFDKTDILKNKSKKIYLAFRNLERIIEVVDISEIKSKIEKELTKEVLDIDYILCLNSRLKEIVDVSKKKLKYKKNLKMRKENGKKK